MLAPRLQKRLVSNFNGSCISAEYQLQFVTANTTSEPATASPNENTSSVSAYYSTQKSARALACGTAAAARSLDLDHLYSFFPQRNSGRLGDVARHAAQSVYFGEFGLVERVVDEVAALVACGAEDG